MFAAELVRTRDRNGGVSDRFVSMGTEVSHIGLCPGCTNLRGVLVLTRMHLILIPCPPPPHLPPLPSSLSLPLCLSRSLSLSPNPPLRPRILSLSLVLSRCRFRILRFEEAQQRRRTRQLHALLAALPRATRMALLNMCSVDLLALDLRLTERKERENTREGVRTGEIV